MTRFDRPDQITVDVSGLIRRLILFETYILQTIRKGIPSLDRNARLRRSNGAAFIGSPWQFESEDRGNENVFRDFRVHGGRTTYL